MYLLSNNTPPPKKTDFSNILFVQEFQRNVREHWNHMLEHGFMSAWTNLVDSLDPFGEKNSLKVLGLEAGATQEQIKSR